MATFMSSFNTQNSSQRSLAMVLSLASAVVLSPLYINRKRDSRYYEAKWGGPGFVVAVVVVGLVIAIRTSSVQNGGRGSVILSSDPSWLHRIGRSSWGLAGVLVMLVLVISWQNSVQEFLWR